MHNQQSITSFLQSHAAGNPVSFHMPGHKGADIYRENGYGAFLDNFMDCDITEIPGADNLFRPEEIIAETMARYRELYRSKETYLLINGSSAGLIASILTAVKPGGKLIMARNCHKSIFNGLALAGGQPVYAYPEIIPDYGISGEITANEIERCLAEHPDSDAVILPSPNYYGICSDIEAITKAVHDAGKILIVDEAHGAHLKFFDTYINRKKLAAENLGADIVIASTHKTLASFTQSAVVGIFTERIDKHRFEDKLQLLESTSPSYLLMASLDINADLLKRHGEALIRDWEENLQWFYSRAAQIPGLAVMRHPMMDHTKINLDMSAYGISGQELEKHLMDRGIFVELTTSDILMCMTGIGNRRYDYERLLAALSDIASERKLQSKEAEDAPLFPTGKPVFSAVPKKAVLIPVACAVGRVCASPVVPYPPGTPLFCPGEIMDGDTLAYVEKLWKQGKTVIGMDRFGRVYAGEEQA